MYSKLLKNIELNIDCIQKTILEKDKPVNNASAMSSDLTDGLNLVKQICEKYGNEDEYE